MIYHVAVRALCEFAARSGDLDLRFTPAPTAREGQEGHLAVTARRGPGYRAEVPLAGRCGDIHLRGRCDGYDPARGRLEEIKTYRGRFSAIPANHQTLHRAQARLYGWLLCEQENLPALTVALVYFNVDTGEETVLEEQQTRASLHEQTQQLCDIYQRWAKCEAAHRQGRDQGLTELPFPHAAFRPGQRPLAEAVFRCARRGGALLAQAPTGIGKTVATLFPLLKACPAEAIDKVFYLAARTTGRSLALAALAQLTGNGAPLRVLELTAREKSCVHPGLACHGESCPLARGFHDRLPAARQAAAGRGLLTQELLRELAQEYAVCPYYLAQEMAWWCDVVVADYNYYFDASAMLHAMTEARGWRVALLVDEAHNLLERGRQMYSAELHPATLATARRQAPRALVRPLSRLHKAWQGLGGEMTSGFECRSEPPAAVSGSLQAAIAGIADHLQQHPEVLQPSLQDLYFDALRFQQLSESLDAHSLFTISRADGASTLIPVLGIRNVVPAPFLAERFASAQCSILFSATLVPSGFHRTLLGLPEDCGWIDVPSPFSAGQLAVRVIPLSTRFRHRSASVAPIARLIATQFRRQTGNYLAFFSSHDYLQEVARQLETDCPDIPLWRQDRGMSETARGEFLARFQPGGHGVGFAVLGGAFAEGIDLPGSRLIGAFIATLGLPQLNPLNEAFRCRLEVLHGKGYDYTYLYPGMQKVVQAAGRVIRTPEDQGTVFLIDDRFLQAGVRRLLPAWWNFATPEQAAAPPALTPAEKQKPPGPAATGVA